MPEKAKTSCQSGETGYDMYLREAEQQVCYLLCVEFIFI